MHGSAAWDCKLGLYGGRCAPSIADVCRRRQAIDASEGPVFQIRVVAREPKAVDRSEWPLLARGIARLALPEDVGVGDTVKRVIGKAGEVWEALTNGCSACADRRAHLNAKFPYSRRGSAG